MVDEPTFDVIGMYETHSRGEITDYILHTYAADGVTAGELEDCFAQIEALKAEGPAVRARHVRGHGRAS